MKEDIPLGDPPVIQHATPTGVNEIAQRLIPFPFTPPDVKLKDKEALSASNDWFTKHDKNKIDELGSLDFYVTSGPQSVGVVPKLHNTSAGIEIYELAPPLSKETFEKTEGPFRSGKTRKFSNKRSGKKIAKFKVGSMAESGLACFYMSRLLGHLVAGHPRLIGRWTSRSSARSEARPAQPATRIAPQLGLICVLERSRATRKWCSQVGNSYMDPWL